MTLVVRKVRPVGGREVVEREQFVAVASQAGGGLDRCEPPAAVRRAASPERTPTGTPRTAPRPPLRPTAARRCEEGPPRGRKPVLAPPAKPQFRCSCAVCSCCRNRLSQLDFSKDTPHDSTHPDTTFDHSSRLHQPKPCVASHCRVFGSQAVTQRRLEQPWRVWFRDGVEHGTVAFGTCCGVEFSEQGLQLTGCPASLGSGPQDLCSSTPARTTLAKRS